MSRTSYVASLPLLVAALYCGSIYLNSPIPPDPNSPSLFLSALQGEPNLLSQLVRAMLWAPPSVTAFTIVLVSIIAFYLAAYLIVRQLKLGNLASLLPPSLLLVFPHIAYTASVGLSTDLLPAGIASLGLAISAFRDRKWVAAGLGCTIFSAFINPVYSVAVGLVALAWVAIKWIKNRKGDVPLKHPIFAFNSILVSAVGFSVVKPINSLQPAPSFLNFQQQPVFFLLLFIAAAAGFLLLIAWKKDIDMAMCLVAWTASAFVVGSLTGTLLFLAVPLSVLASIPFIFGAKDVVAVKSVEGDEHIIEVDALKVLALGVVTMLVLSALSVNIQNIFPLTNSKGVGSEHLFDVAAYLKGRNASIVAPSSILPWLALYSGQKLPSSDYRLLDSWGESSFRLQSNFVRVDDWEPFSASRAPRIAIYDGKRFTYLIYIDDSYVRFTMKTRNSTWIESPYGMAFLGWRWLNATALELSFQSRWLSIKKILNVEGQSVTVSYAFSAIGDARVDSGEISIFAEWPYTIDSFEGGGSLFFLTVGGKSFSFKTSEGSVSNYLAEGVPRVVVTKRLGVVSGVLTLKVDCLDATFSNIPPYLASLFDYFNQGGEKFLVGIKTNPYRFENVTTFYSPSFSIIDSYNTVKFEVREPISFVLADSYVRVSFYTYTKETAPLLYVVDSYVRASFSLNGSTYIEAPSIGRVLHESIKEGGGRHVTYETAGLLINKALTTSGSTVSFNYTFAAKNGGKVTAVDGVIWLPWGMNYTYVIGRGYILLETPMGPFNITYGKLNVTIGPYPEGGQPAIRLYGTGHVLSFSVSAIQPIYIDYLPTSRPQMDGSDIIFVSAPYLMGPWVESPAGALIESKGSAQWIAKTKALTFEKRLNLSEERVDVMYSFAPNNGSNVVILGGWGLVWLNLDISKVEHAYIPYGLQVEGFNITGGPSTDAALLSVSEYGTPVLNITFSGQSLAISFSGELKYFHQTSLEERLDDIILLEGFLKHVYEESPSNAHVLKDIQDPGSDSRVIEYRTAGLLFTKTVKLLGNKALSVSYYINASSSAIGRLEAIHESKAYIWIPWERLLLNYSIEGSTINLNLDIGSFSVQISPSPYNVTFIPHPQPTFLILYKMNPTEFFSYTLMITSQQQLDISYQEAGRPHQASSDILIVKAQYGYLEPVFDVGDLKVFKVV